MNLALRLLPWLRRLTAVRNTRGTTKARPGAPPSVVEAGDDTAIDAQVMRRRVQHFCDEFPAKRPMP